MHIHAGGHLCERHADQQRGGDGGGRAGEEEEKQELREFRSPIRQDRVHRAQTHFLGCELRCVCAPVRVFLVLFKVYCVLCVYVLHVECR